MVSQYGHNQPWKVQVKILEEDQDDFKAVMSSSDFAAFQFRIRAGAYNGSFCHKWQNAV